MAKDETQNDKVATPRVYKASGVHKRRAKPSSRSGEAQAPAAGEGARQEVASSNEAAESKEAAALSSAPAEQATPNLKQQGEAASEPEPDSDGKPSRFSKPKPVARPRFTYASYEDSDQDGSQEALQGEDGSPANPEDGPSAESADQESAKPSTGGRFKLAKPNIRKQDDDAGPEKSEAGGKAPKKKRSLALRIVGALLAVILAAFLLFAGYFCAQRWFLHDDHTSMVGEWFVSGTNVPVSITDDTIRLNAETKYDYEIDQTAKTIRYRFGALEGRGRYWFAEDRQTLVITDGAGFTAWSTALDDIARGAKDFFDNTFGGGAQLPSGDGVIALSKTATAPAATAKPSQSAAAASPNGSEGGASGASGASDKPASEDESRSNQSQSVGEITFPTAEEIDPTIANSQSSNAEASQ